MEKQLLAEKVATALEATLRMETETPGWQSVGVARDQLRLIQESLASPSPDVGVLSSINLGVLAVREFDQRNPEYADLLMEIQRLVKAEIEDPSR